jgi:hypothetical protein
MKIFRNTDPLAAAEAEVSTLRSRRERLVARRLDDKQVALNRATEARRVALESDDDSVIADADGALARAEAELRAARDALAGIDLQIAAAESKLAASRDQRERDEYLKAIDEGIVLVRARYDEALRALQALGEVGRPGSITHDVLAAAVSSAIGVLAGPVRELQADLAHRRSQVESGAPLRPQAPEPTPVPTAPLGEPSGISYRVPRSVAFSHTIRG